MQREESCEWTVLSKEERRSGNDVPTKHAKDEDARSTEHHQAGVHRNPIHSLQRPDPQPPRLRGIRRGRFVALKTPPTPQKLECISRHFPQLFNLAVTDTVVGHVNVHIDCHLISCHASLYRAS